MPSLAQIHEDAQSWLRVVPLSPEAQVNRRAALDLLEAECSRETHGRHIFNSAPRQREYQCAVCGKVNARQAA